MIRIPVLVVCLTLALSACSRPAPEAPAAPVVVPTIEVSAPLGGAIVTSPLRVIGTAPNTWYFEAVFSAELRDARGMLIAEGPAQAQGDWMQSGQVPFVAQLRFAVPVQTDAVIVLTEDTTGADHATGRELRIPVILAPPLPR